MIDKSSALKVLGLTNSPSEEDIKKAYKKMSVKCHPDKVREARCPTASEHNLQSYEQAFREIANAFQCLTDEKTCLEPAGTTTSTSTRRSTERVISESILEALKMAYNVSQKIDKMQVVKDKLASTTKLTEPLAKLEYAENIFAADFERLVKAMDDELSCNTDDCRNDAILEQEGEAMLLMSSASLVMSEAKSLEALNHTIFHQVEDHIKTFGFSGDAKILGDAIHIMMGQFS